MHIRVTGSKRVKQAINVTEPLTMSSSWLGQSCLLCGWAFNHTISDVDCFNLSLQLCNHCGWTFNLGIFDSVCFFMWQQCIRVVHTCWTTTVWIRYEKILWTEELSWHKRDRNNGKKKWKQWRETARTSEALDSFLICCLHFDVFLANNRAKHSRGAVNRHQ